MQRVCHRAAVSSCRAFLPGGNEFASASLINYYRTEENMQRKGFTLIELLVVIAIIAIVVASKVGFFLQFSAIFAFKAL